MKDVDMKAALPLLEFFEKTISSENLKTSLKIVQEAVKGGLTLDQLMVSVGMTAFKSVTEPLTAIAKSLDDIKLEMELSREALTEVSKAVYEVAVETGGHRQR